MAGCCGRAHAKSDLREAGHTGSSVESSPSQVIKCSLQRMNKRLMNKQIYKTSIKVLTLTAGVSAFKFYSSKCNLGVIEV